MNKNTWSLIILFAVASIPMTIAGQFIFCITMFDTIISEFFTRILLCILVWPSVLLELFGVSIGIDSTMFFPNLIGWAFIGLIIGFISQTKRKKRPLE